MFLSKNASKAIQKGCLLTGPARTGSTLWGKILGSFENTVYLYEPESLHALFPVSNIINKNTAKMLFEAYLYEDKFLNILTGRGFNINKNDESCVFNYKSKEYVEKTLSISWRKNSASHFGQSKKMVVKITDITAYYKTFLSLFPKIQTLITLREPKDCIISLIEKKWFSNSALKNKILIWPFQNEKGIGIPTWVPCKDKEYWIQASEYDRAAFYYTNMLKIVLPRKNQMYLSYEKLCTRPFEEIKKVAEFCGSSISKQTTLLIKKIRKPDKKNYRLWERIELGLRTKTEKAYLSLLQKNHI